MHRGRSPCDCLALDLYKYVIASNTLEHNQTISYPMTLISGCMRNILNGKLAIPELFSVKWMCPVLDIPGSHGNKLFYQLLCIPRAVIETESLAESRWHGLGHYWHVTSLSRRQSAPGQSSLSLQSLSPLSLHSLSTLSPLSLHSLSPPSHSIQ